jgi:hypothetical protein
MGRREGSRNKKRQWALDKLLDAERRYHSYGGDERIPTPTALKQLRYRVSREARVQKAITEAWASERGIDLNKLSSTSQWSLNSLVGGYFSMKLPTNPVYEVGLEEIARKIKAGEL